MADPCSAYVAVLVALSSPPVSVSYWPTIAKVFGFQLSGHVVLAHAVIGLFEWLGIVYVSVSEILWTMFLLAHVLGHRRIAWLAVSSIPVGVTVLAPELLFGVVWCGSPGWASSS